MHRSRWFLAFLILALAAPLIVLPSVRAEENGYPYAGVDLGVSVPTNGNYRAHVQLGGVGRPFAGYMFNDYIGVQGDIEATFQPPDNDHRGFNHENQWSSMLGFMAGPRLTIPLGEMFDLYGIGEGGYFTGLSGRLNHSAPGFSVGGGLEYNLTYNLALGAFGRWNRVYMSPRPTDLGPTQVSSERFGEDVRYATAGVSLRYSFRERPAPPRMAQAPPPPPPPPPMKKKIVLRSVHFDFNKSNIRKDAEPILDEAAQMLKDEGTVAVICEGHTDSIGSDAYNMRLSRQRADAVRSYLVSHGVPASRIRTEGLGESKPVASNDTADGRAQNRRVELRVQ